MDGGGDRDPETDLRRSNTAVIREVYDSEYAHEAFAMKLERALDAKCSVIIIEPALLGDETARWISVGNCLHKTAVMSGLACIVAGAWSRRPVYCCPLGILSFLCTGLYTVSWQFDPCVKYQVEKDQKHLVRLPVVSEMPSLSSVVVLVRKGDTKRKLLHCGVCLVSMALCAYRIYRSAK